MGRAWGRVRVDVAITIRAPRQRLVQRYLDYSDWSRLFPATIRGVRVLRAEPGEITVEVDHRTAGRVINIIRPRSATEIELEEFKPKYDATFVNRFDAVPHGTRYTVIADIRLKAPYGLLAPFLRGYVRRLVRRAVLEPMRASVEGDDARTS